jgi:thymidylate synthase
VRRGAPCGATWDAAARLQGLPVDEASIRIGLETQYFCTANPAGWDPMYGKSPVHFAGDIHKAALRRALGENT